MTMTYATDNLENIHAWKAVKGFLVSFEDTKKLHAFDTKDDLINFLFLSGYKQTARKFNKEL